MPYAMPDGKARSCLSSRSYGFRGYPYWCGGSTRDPVFHRQYRWLYEHAVGINDTRLDVLRNAAREAQMTVVMGLHERDGGTIYNTQLFIGDDGRTLGAHRKLMPTTNERLVHGRGDGSDIAAHDTPFGKLGGLLCYEHQMALARYALASCGVEIHAAQWPGHQFLDPIVDASMRQLAFENACFVLVAREIFSADRLPADFPKLDGDEEYWVAHGGSGIVAPDGSYITGPVFDEESIIYGEIDPAARIERQWWFDTTGHYARPDVFRLLWCDAPRAAVERRPVDSEYNNAECHGPGDREP